MSETTDSVIVLNRALDQLGDLVAAVREDHLGNPTPCADWNVQQLVTHVLVLMYIVGPLGYHPDMLKRNSDRDSY